MAMEVEMKVKELQASMAMEKEVKVRNFNFHDYGGEGEGEGEGEDKKPATQAETGVSGIVPEGPFPKAKRRFVCILAMKFLEYTPLVRINAFLTTVNLGDSFLKGNLEAYSCKAAGLDKKYFRSLEQEVIDSLVSSPPSLSASPIGPLSSSGSRKTFIYLVLAMNHVYPDYDFSLLHPTSFEKEECQTAKSKIDDYLRETAKVWASKFGEDSLLCSSIWEAIDEVIGIEDSDIYAYKPDPESDPLTERGTIWSFSYFFYNRRLRRILCFCCQCLSKLAMDEDSLDEMLSEDEADYLEGMDMD
ncbi:hypothetical protein L7F22_015566 [Adiantum nelumboides]|nr:hypothetical protein [Adiantum nelumboides]